MPARRKPKPAAPDQACSRHCPCAGRKLQTANLLDDSTGRALSPVESEQQVQTCTIASQGAHADPDAGDWEDAFHLTQAAAEVGDQHRSSTTRPAHSGEPTRRRKRRTTPATRKSSQPKQVPNVHAACILQLEKLRAQAEQRIASMQQRCTVAIRAADQRRAQRDDSRWNQLQHENSDLQVQLNEALAKLQTQQAIATKLAQRLQQAEEASQRNRPPPGQWVSQDHHMQAMQRTTATLRAEILRLQSRAAMESEDGVAPSCMEQSRGRGGPCVSAGQLSGMVGDVVELSAEEYAGLLQRLQTAESACSSAKAQCRTEKDKAMLLRREKARVEQDLQASLEVGGSVCVCVVYGASTRVYVRVAS